MPMDLVIEETDSLPPAPAAVPAMPPMYRPGRPPFSPRSSPVSNSDHAPVVCADQVRLSAVVPVIINILTINYLANDRKQTELTTWTGLSPVSTSRVDGPSTRLVETGL